MGAKMQLIGMSDGIGRGMKRHCSSKAAALSENIEKYKNITARNTLSTFREKQLPPAGSMPAGGC